VIKKGMLKKLWWGNLLKMDTWNTVKGNGEYHLAESWGNS
jgi:hypothetical protein